MYHRMGPSWSYPGEDVAPGQTTVILNRSDAYSDTTRCIKNSSGRTRIPPFRADSECVPGQLGIARRRLRLPKSPSERA